MADDLYSILQQVDPATLQKMVDAGIFEEKSVPLQQQFKMGQGMANTPMAQGQTVGSTFVASSPLEHLANALRQYQGVKATKSAMQSESDLANQRGAGRLAYLKLLAQQQQPPATSGAAPMPVGE